MLSNRADGIALIGQLCGEKRGSPVLIKLFLIPLLSAFIGWITNVIAIRLLFYPRQPWRLPLIGWELQGLLPRRQADLARDIGVIIEQELLSLENLLEKVRNPEVQGHVIEAISNAVIGRFRNSVPAFVPAFLVRLAEDNIYSFLQREAPVVLEQVMSEVSTALKNDVSIGAMIEERLREYEIGDLERLVIQVAARELRWIEWLGGVLGFFIGLVQLSLVYVFR